MIVYIVNSISLNMFPQLGELTWEPATNEKVNSVKELLKNNSEDPVIIPAIGHEDLARIIDVPCNRISVNAKYGDKFLVAQYIGPRLSEGSTTLPDGASIRWYWCGLFRLKLFTRR